MASKDALLEGIPFTRSRLSAVSEMENCAMLSFMIASASKLALFLICVMQDTLQGLAPVLVARFVLMTTFGVLDSRGSCCSGDSSRSSSELDWEKLRRRQVATLLLWWSSSDSSQSFSTSDSPVVYSPLASQLSRLSGVRLSQHW